MAWSSRRLVFAGLAVLLLAPALLSSVGGVLAACGDSEEEEEYYYVEDEYLESIEIRTSILVIATTLIILSILFEVGKEKVEETTGEEMEPIIEHLWQEMTVLGFLSVLTFLVTYVGLLDPISCAIFDESELLNEMVEDVHMLLFAVMVVFIIYCLILVRFGERVQKQWRNSETACHHPKRLKADYLDAIEKLKEGRKGLYKWAPRFDPLYAKVELMFYYLVRQEFIRPRSETAKPLPKLFDFSLYQSMVLGEMLGELVEISPFVWFLLFLFFCFCWVFTFLPVNAVIPFYVAFGWLLLMLFYIVMRKLEMIRLELIPTLKCRADLSINEDDLHLEPPRFLKKPLVTRGPLERTLLGPPANKHQRLFWFDRKGPRFIFALVRFLIILSAVYIAGILPMIVVAPSIYWIFALVPLCLLPILIYAVFIMPQIIKRWVLVANIEMMKRPDLITRVIRLQKTKQSLKTLKVIQMMRLNTRKVRKEQSVEEGKSRKELSQEKKHELEEVFKLFDTDNSGNISAEELQAVFSTLGQELDEVEAMELLNELDKDGDGELSFEEFCGYLEEQLNDDDMTAEEMAESMFCIFDADDSGTITVEEFKETLKKVGTSLSYDDIQAIVDEIDEDQSGTVSLEEFEEMVKKHLIENKH